MTKKLSACFLRTYLLTHALTQVSQCKHRKKAASCCCTPEKSSYLITGDIILTFSVSPLHSVKLQSTHLLIAVIFVETSQKYTQVTVQQLSVKICSLKTALFH